MITISSVKHQFHRMVLFMNFPLVSLNLHMPLFIELCSTRSTVFSSAVTNCFLQSYNLKDTRQFSKGTTTLKDPEQPSQSWIVKT